MEFKFRNGGENVKGWMEEMGTNVGNERTCDDAVTISLSFERKRT